MNIRATVDDALAAIRESSEADYGVLLQRGTLEIGFYKPQEVDPQQPHEQDEVYVVQAGHGSFVVDGETTAFTAGDALFVPAGVSHRFVDFSDDFAAWVIFYGPRGGEMPGG